MQIGLERINALSGVSLAEFTNLFSFEFSSWISVLIDTLNEDINKLENAINNLAAPSFTAAELVAMTPNIQNGQLFYDTTNNEYVGVQAGVLVKLVTAAYP